MVRTHSSRRHSFTDYLGVEEMSAVRHEYFKGKILAIPGDSPDHAALSAAIIAFLANRNDQLRVFGCNLRVRALATGLATYPDAAVVCGPLERDPESPTHIVNPKVIVEVLSPATETYDREEKREHYQAIPSLMEYVLVAQSERVIEVFHRDGGGWSHRVHRASDDVTLESIDVSFPVAALYDRAGV